MKASHVTGGVVGVAVAAILVGLLHHYRVTSVSDADAVLVGGALGAAGIGIAHAVWDIGVGPIFSRILHGPPKPAQAPPPTLVQ